MSQGTKQQKQAKVLTAVEQRNKTDRHGPRVEEDEGRRRKHGCEDRAEVLKYVVTI